MSELFFPTLGAAVVVGIVLPLCAALSKLVLVLLDRLSGTRLVRWGAARFLLLVLPSVVPIAWTISAGLHQAESGRSVIGCIFSHELEQLCLEPLLFAGLLTSVVLGCVGPWLFHARRFLHVRGSRDSAEAIRVAALVAGTPAIRALKDRVIVTDGSIGGSAAVGVWRPVVAIDADFVQRCDDETLVGALAHELEHLRGGDPLRYLLLALAMRLNPLGEWLLRREAAAWIFRREVQCDRAAVVAGAEPLAVASALLRASRASHAALAHVTGSARSKIGLRIELLLAYAEKPPQADRGVQASALGFVILVALAAIATPHVGGTDPLDIVHTTVERFAATLIN